MLQQAVHRFTAEHETGMPVVLDPFAGTGRIHELTDCVTIGVELEPEWAAMHDRTIVGDATSLPWYWGDWFDMVITSPTYGNRMADRHTPSPEDTSRRITYTHQLGRKLHPRNTGGLQWGDEYRRMHRIAWSEALRVLSPGGWFVLNIRNHIRDDREVHVSEWHRETAIELGFVPIVDAFIKTPGMRFGANGSKRVDGEHIFMFAKPQPDKDPS